MENNVLQKRWVQGSNVVVDDLRGTMFTGEIGAHTFLVSGVGSAQETVPITGTITGRFLAANNVSIPLEGSVADGVASLTLTEDCYIIPGRFVLSIYATNGGVKQCIYCGVGNVFRTQSDIIEYPSASIPDIEQIIADAQAAVTEINADVAAAQAAVAAAQTAVDGIEDQRQTMIASIASVAGQGTDTTLTQSGVAADAKATGDQVRDLKSALEQDIDSTAEMLGKYENVSFIPAWEQGAIDGTTGAETVADNRIRTNYFHVEESQFSITSKSGYKFLLFCFNAIGESPAEIIGWLDGITRTVNNNYPYYRLMMYVNGQSVTVPYDGVNVQITITNPYKTLNNRFLEISSDISETNDRINDVENEIKSLPSGYIIYENKVLSNLTDAVLPSGSSFENGKLHQTHAGSGNNWWTLNFNPTSAYNNILEFDFDVESITGTGRVYLFAYNTSNVLQYISLGLISASGHFSYELDFNYYAVYNSIDISRPASVGVANFTDTFDAVYTTANVFEPIINQEDEGKPVNLLIESMGEKLDALDSSESDVTDTVVSPNGTKYYIAVANDGTLQAKPVIPSGKVLLIGNSLLFGFQTFGMCASDSEHDYYWNIRKTLLPLSQNLSITRIMGTPFEECTTNESANTWMSNNLGNVLSNDYTLAVIQLGDNVNNAQRLAVFHDNAVALINYIKARCANVRIAWAGEWYYSKQKQDIIAKVCRKTGSVFIDISSLVTDENKGAIGNVIHRTSSSTTSYNVTAYTDDAVNHELTITFIVDGENYQSVVPYDSYTASDNTISITGYYTVVTSSGVASHPGNSGMLAIANKVLFTLGITNSPDEIQ